MFTYRWCIMLFEVNNEKWNLILVCLMFWYIKKGSGGCVIRVKSMMCALSVHSSICKYALSQILLDLIRREALKQVSSSHEWASQSIFPWKIFEWVKWRVTEGHGESTRFAEIWDIFYSFWNVWCKLFITFVWMIRRFRKQWSHSRQCRAEVPAAGGDGETVICVFFINCLLAYQCSFCLFFSSFSYCEFTFLKTPKLCMSSRWSHMHEPFLGLNEHGPCPEDSALASWGNHHSLKSSWSLGCELSRSTLDSERA